jgi:ankyrin repeat protein
MSSGTTALEMAVGLGHVSIVETLIAAGADVARDRRALLESARRSKNKEIEKLILDAGKTVPKKATPAPK